MDKGLLDNILNLHAFQAELAAGALARPHHVMKHLHPTGMNNHG